MEDKLDPAKAYVIKVAELSVLNHLASNHPRPRHVEWINRGTDQKLRRSSIDMLMRTLFQDVASPSVVQLHRSSGLRTIFGTAKERDAFAATFEKARAQLEASSHHLVTAIFDDREQADRVVEDLIESRIPKQSISLLRLASQFMDTDAAWPEGHSKMSIAGATAGAGVAGAVLGAVMLMIPGIGPVAAAGAVAASSISSVTAISGIIGATGGAIARMLTDSDVDGVAATFYEQQIRRGKIFLSVDIRIAKDQRETVRKIMTRHGGRTVTRH